MSKAILVIDLDDDIIEDYDTITIDYDVRGLNINDDFIESIKYIEGAKLKPMPNKNDSKIPYLGNRIKMSNGEEVAYYMGWNDCIDEITGGEE